MSSNFKKDLKKEATKTSEAEVTSDVVTLPPDAGDVVYTVVTDDSVVGEVNAKLEMSYDKENWCPAVREEAGGSGTTTYSFSNQFCVDTTATPLPTGDPPVAAEDVAKNKYAVGQLSHNTSGEDVGVGDSAATRDALHHHMNKGDAFNLSWWHKSNVQPSATYNPIIFKHGGHDPYTNKKIIDLIPDGAEKKNKHLNAPTNITLDTFTKCLSVPDSSTTGDYIQAVNTNAAHANGILSAGGATIPTKSWTCSVWYKAPSGPIPTGDTTRFMFALNNTHGVALFTDGELKLLSPWRNLTVTMPTGIDLWDNEWHLVTWTFLADGTTSASSSFHNDAWDGTTPGDFLYIDGVQCGGQWNHSIFPPYYTSEDFILAGCESHSSYESLPGKYTHWALESGAQSPTQALARYNNGTPLDLSSTVEYYLNFEDDSNDSGTSNISSSTNLTEKGTGYNGSGTPGSDYPTAVNGTSFSITTLSDTDMKAQVDRDIFDSKLGADKSFTINKWFKSSVEPNATDSSPVLFNNGAKKTVPEVENFDVVKYVYTKMKDSYNTAGKNRAIYVQNPWTYSDWASSTNWSISMWLKYDGDDSSGTFGMIQHGTRGIQIGKNATSIYLTHNLPSTDPTVTIPATLNDGNWHNVTITNSNSATYQTMGTDPSTCNTLVYLNGALVTPSSGGTATSTVTYGNDSSNPVYLNLGASLSGDVGASSTFLHVSTWTKTLSSTEVNSILGANDKPKDLSGQSNLACWLPLGDGYDTSNPSTVDTVVGSSAKFWDMSGNGRHALPHQADTAGGNVLPANSDVGWDQTDSPVEGVTNLGTSENVYIAPSSTPAYDIFGNGLTASFTKKVVTVPWGNTKYYSSHSGYGIYQKTSRILNENVATGSSPLIRYDRDWTISWWMKSPDNAAWGMIGTRDRHNNSTGTGWENEFGITLSNTYLHFHFTDSNGADVGKRIYYTGAVGMDGDFQDGDWHFVTVTFNANGATSGDFEFQPSNALSTASNSNPDNQRSMTVYVDGQRFANDASITGSTYHNILGTVSDCAITSGNKEWYWVEYNSHA